MDDDLYVRHGPLLKPRTGACNVTRVSRAFVASTSGRRTRTTSGLWFRLHLFDNYSLENTEHSGRSRSLRRRHGRLGHGEELPGGSNRT
jgi:hypothetical protein